MRQNRMDRSAPQKIH